MSEAIVKRIAFGENGGIVGVSSIVGFVLLVGSTVRKYLQRKRGVGETRLPLLPGPAAPRDHCNSLGGNDWKALIAAERYNNAFDSRPG